MLNQPATPQDVASDFLSCHAADLLMLPQGCLGLIIHLRWCVCNHTHSCASCAGAMTAGDFRFCDDEYGCRGCPICKSQVRLFTNRSTIEPRLHTMLLLNAAWTMHHMHAAILPEAAAQSLKSEVASPITCTGSRRQMQLRGPSKPSR